MVESKADRYGEAIATFKKAIALKPDNAEAYYKMGHSYKELKQYSEASDAFKKVISIKPDFAETYFYMGIAYSHLKQYTKAIAALKKCIALRPTGKNIRSAAADRFKG